MTAPVALDVSVSAVFDSTGTARAYIGPTVFGHTWHVTRTVTTVDISNGTEEHRLYLNAENPARLIAGSYTGWQDFNETDMTLQTLDKLIAVWTLGDAGTTATLQLAGTISDRRRG